MSAGLIGTNLYELVLRRYWSTFQSAHFNTSASRAGYKISNNLRDCYQLLHVEQDADDDEIKQSYVRLAKLYHPDSSSTTAEPNKFHQLQEAYRTIKTHRSDTEARMTAALSMTPDEEDDDLAAYTHKSPQHRQFLNNEGVGYGTPSQRQRQYQSHKVDRASEAVTNRRISLIQSQYEDAMLTLDKKATRKRTVRSGMERLVEDLIQESMSKGEFKNLPGEGKPLARPEAPQNVDDLTFNLNKIIKDQGFAPEWVRLNGGISKDLSKARESLRNTRVRAGPEPVSQASNKLWMDGLADFKAKMVDINKKVDRLNLVAPTMNLQQLRYDANTEIEKISLWYKDQVNNGLVPKPPETQVKTDEVNIKKTDPGLWQGIKDLFSNR